MILRRVIDHFRKQEWAAIAIDFVIVVLGVFVGLQVNNWHQARQDRKDERFYVTPLHEDLLSAETFSSRLLQRRIDKRDGRQDEGGVDRPATGAVSAPQSDGRERKHATQLCLPWNRSLTTGPSC